MSAFTTDDAITVIEATKSGGRAPKATPKPDALADDLNHARLYFGTLVSSKKEMIKSSDEFADEFKEYAATLEKRIGTLLKLLSPENEKEKRLMEVWHMWLQGALGNKTIEVFIEKMVDDLSALQKAGQQARNRKDYFLTNPAIHGIKHVTDSVARVVDGKKSEFLLITQILPPIFEEHFKQKFGITLVPKEGSGTKFTKACLEKMGLSVSNSTLHEYWHRRDREAYVDSLTA